MVADILVAVMKITFEMLVDVRRNFMRRVVLRAKNAGRHIPCSINDRRDIGAITVLIGTTSLPDKQMITLCIFGPRSPATCWSDIDRRYWHDIGKNVVAITLRSRF